MKAAENTKKYLDASDREQQILETAINFVAQRGLGFTTRELAKALSVSQPLLYRYFKSKDELLTRIYEEVYLKRWDPTWNDALKDRSRPMRDRLIDYLKAYTDAILDENWIRIFIASSLEDPMISQKYLGMLHETTFPLIFAEIAAEAGAEVPEGPQAEELIREVIWGFHSSFFYLGVRKFIYRGDIPDDLEEVIRVRVDVLLNGLPATIGQIRECSAMETVDD